MSEASSSIESATRQFLVTAQDTSIALGSGDLPVLATPQLIAWCEAVCVQVLTLDENSTSVGTRVDVEHVGACAVGTRVNVTASISYRDGRLIRFDVMAESAVDGDSVPVRLMQGTVTRVVVNPDRFMTKVAK